MQKEKTQNQNKLLDKEWRLNHCYKIVNKNKQVVPFILNRAQRDFNSGKTNRNIILKSRQLGFTTYESIDGLDDTLFEKNIEVLMLSYDLPSQLDIFDNKIKFAWDNFNESLKKSYELDADRANKLKFNWGDGSKSSITVRTRGRSGTFNRLHISEFAKICAEDPKGAKEIISGTIQAVPLSGRVDIESTAEDDVGEFYTMFMEAWNRGKVKTPVDFTAFFYNWTYDDEEINSIIPMDVSEMPKEFRDYKELHELTSSEITYYYYKWLSLNKDWRLLRREYPTTPEEAFSSSGERFFDTAQLERMKTREPIIEVGGWRYYADYIPGHRYALAADPSEGVGQDNAICAVMDFDAKDPVTGSLRPEVVAVYESDMMPPDKLAYIARDGATRYGNCIIAVERNNHGHTTLAILKGIYYNIYKEHKDDRDSDGETEKLGWHTNGASKPKMLFDMNTAINESIINIPDRQTLSQFKSFPRREVDVKTSQKDEGGKHYDEVIAACICWQMKSHAKSNRVVITSGESVMDPFSPINQI